VIKRWPMKWNHLLIATAISGPAIFLAAQTAQQPSSTLSPGRSLQAAPRGAVGTQRGGDVEVLTDTLSVDFGPYLKDLKAAVRKNWYRLIPQSAMMGKQGKVSIEFIILKDGRITGMTLSSTSGDVALERAAWAGITASDPFAPLPNEFTGQYQIAFSLPLQSQQEHAI
jgi:TonB family protein